jgi:ABC-type bacteriocin/lantibiotic exporter with double-glycine peptidase domain
MEIVAVIIALIVPIGVAIWTVRSSAKDTAKQIAALEESTTKQIESIKELSRLQMDASIKQVELEIEKNLFFAKQAQQEAEGIQNINNSGLSHIQEWKNGVSKQWQDQKPERDYHFYSQFVKELEVIKQGLVANKKKLD